MAEASRPSRPAADSRQGRGEAQEAEAEAEDGAEAGLGGEGAGDEDGEPFQLAGRRMTKKERKAARKSRKTAARTPLGSPPLQTDSLPVIPVPSTSLEPSPLLSVLDSEDRGSDGEGTKSSPQGRRRPDASPGSGGRAEPPDSDPLGFEELLPPPALPLDGDGPDAADALLEASPCACGSSGSPRAGEAARGSGSGWGSELDMLELGAASPSPAVPDSVRDGNETVCIDVRWPWPKIQELLGSRAGASCGKPLLIVSQSGHTPFGSTSFYAFPGLAFEVMQNGWLASLTVFSVPREELPPAFLPRKGPQ